MFHKKNLVFETKNNEEQELVNLLNNKLYKKPIIAPANLFTEERKKKF